MSANSKQLTQLIVVFLGIILGLALTGSVASMTQDARYIPINESFEVEPLVSLEVVTTYVARDGEADYKYFRVKLNDTDVDGRTELDVTEDITYDAGSKTLTIGDDILDEAKDYLVTVYYQYLNPSGAVQAIVTLTPLIWVLVILAIGITAIYVVLQHKGG